MLPLGLTHTLTFFQDLFPPSLGYHEYIEKTEQRSTLKYLCTNQIAAI